MRILITFICFALTTVAMVHGQRGSFSLPEVTPEERQFRVVYEWSTIGFAYRSDVERANAIYLNHYIPRNNLISDVKAFANRLYLTIPRMMPGVPATLGWIISPNNDGRTDPEIEPFPSWEMNEIGNCSALQFVQGVAIDPDGIMWVVDSGRSETLSQGKCHILFLYHFIMITRKCLLLFFCSALSFVLSLFSDYVHGPYQKSTFYDSFTIFVTIY